VLDGEPWCTHVTLIDHPEQERATRRCRESSAGTAGLDGGQRPARL